MCAIAPCLVEVARKLPFSKKNSPVVLKKFVGEKCPSGLRS